MVINLGVTRVFHLNHRDVRVDENSPQRSHDFFKTGECLQGSCSSGKGFIYAEPPLCHLKDHNFSAPERFYSRGVKPKKKCILALKYTQVTG